MSRFRYNLHLLFIIFVVIIAFAIMAYKRNVPEAEPAILVAEEPLSPFESCVTSPDPQNGCAGQSAGSEVTHKRQIEHVTLHASGLGDIGMAISLPDPLPPGKMPVLILLGGLGTAENNLHHMPGAGNNAVISYDWPLPVGAPSGFGFLFRMPFLYSDVMGIPGQIASGVEWAAKQPWADEDRISILGFSLGAMATPAAQDLIQQSHYRIHSTIIAYGGAPLSAAFAADPHIRPALMRYMLAPFLALLLHPLEPETHLQNLEGSFLILEGKNDDLISEPLRDRLRDAVPQPKTIVDFEGNHMGVGPDKDALLEKIINSSREWLVKEEAVNPL
jgi:surfactin synthase thioesterase subunit